MTVGHLPVHPRVLNRGCVRAVAVLGLGAVLIGQALVSTVDAAHAVSPSSSPSPTVSSPPAQPTPAGASNQVTWGVAPAENNLGKNRARFTYTVPAGAQILDAMTVVNRSTTSITVRTYASDAFTTSSGTMDLLPATEKPVDIGSWITVKQPTITLKPQQAAVVPFTLTVPANATPGDHTGGVVASLITNEERTSVNLERRLGSRIYLRVLGTLNPALDISGVRVGHHGTINPAAGGSATVTYTVTNSGNVRLRARQSIHVSGPQGILGHTTTLTDLPELLPGSSITRTATVHGVWPATHLTAVVRLRPFAGPDSPPTNAAAVTGSGTAWGWPYGQAIVLAIAIGAALAYRWLRQRRKAKVAVAIDAAVAQALQEANTVPTPASLKSSASSPGPSATAPSRPGADERPAEATNPSQ